MILFLFPVSPFSPNFVIVCQLSTFEFSDKNYSFSHFHNKLLSQFLGEIYNGECFLVPSLSLQQPLNIISGQYLSRGAMWLHQNTQILQCTPNAVLGTGTAMPLPHRVVNCIDVMKYFVAKLVFSTPQFSDLLSKFAKL